MKLSDKKHLIGEGKILRNIIENDEVPNMIFYGPSGVGKTTIANIIAQKTVKLCIDLMRQLRPLRI